MKLSKQELLLVYLELSSKTAFILKKFKPLMYTNPMNGKEHFGYALAYDFLYGNKKRRTYLIMLFKSRNLFWTTIKQVRWLTTNDELLYLL